MVVIVGSFMYIGMVIVVMVTVVMVIETTRGTRKSGYKGGNNSKVKASQNDHPCA